MHRSDCILWAETDGKGFYLPKIFSNWRRSQTIRIFNCISLVSTKNNSGHRKTDSWQMCWRDWRLWRWVMSHIPITMAFLRKLIVRRCNQAVQWWFRRRDRRKWSKFEMLHVLFVSHVRTLRGIARFRWIGFFYTRRNRNSTRYGRQMRIVWIQWTTQWEMRICISVE